MPLRTLVRAFLVAGVLAALLFGVAGRLDWIAAWCLVAMVLVFFAAIGAWMSRHDPGLLQERARPGANVPRWDTLIIRAYTVMMVTLFVTASLDAGRFGWSRVPVALQALAAAGTVMASVVITWCVTANHFLSSRVRIQEDRGHQVVWSGPYRYVRHPMYSGVIVLFPCIGVALGSWLALIPAAVIGVLFVIRTAREDRFLSTDLPGYREYATCVRFRLAPGIW